MLDHLFVGPMIFGGGCTGNAFRWGRSDDVGGIASAIDWR